jgi:hypothetical protein
MKFNWKKALPAFLTGGSFIAVGIMWGFGVAITLLRALLPAVAAAVGVILGVVWTPPVIEE